MGNKCCCSSQNDVVELSNQINDAVTCKSGAMGNQVLVSHNLENNTFSVQGEGTMLGSCPLDCDTAMWEVKVGKNPKGLSIGVMRYNKKGSVDLSKCLDEEQGPSFPTWFLKETVLKEGDIVGIYWDQTDLPMLSFSVNGVVTGWLVTRIRPSSDIHPAVSVKSGSTCEVIFDGTHFKHPPKSGKFKMIICSSSLI